jgi:hypothetical protein
MGSTSQMRPTPARVQIIYRRIPRTFPQWKQKWLDATRLALIACAMP